MENIKIERIYNKRQVYNKLLFGSISLDEYKNNKIIIKNISDTIEDTLEKDIGYTLISIGIGKKRNIILIAPYTSDYTDYTNYLIVTGETKSDLEIPLFFKIEEDNNSEDIVGFIDEIGVEHTEFSEIDIIASMIVKTLKGYRINKSIIESLSENIKKMKTHPEDKTYTYEEAFNEVPDLMSLIEHTNNIVKSEKDSADNKLRKLCKINKVSKFVYGSINFGSLHNGIYITVSVINDVLQLGNKRLAIIKTLTQIGRTNNYTLEENHIELHSGQSNTTSIIPNDADGYYNQTYGLRTPVNSFERGIINYNFIDKGRYIVQINNMDQYNHFVCGILGMDPAVDNDHKEKLVNGIKKVVNNKINETASAGNIRFKINTDFINVAHYTKASGLQEVFKNIKVISDEFKYILKREKSEGNDITITKDIKYEHKIGKVTCNDFSISTNSESIKNSIYIFAKQSLRDHYNNPNQYTSQIIVDKILEKIFDSINTSIVNGKMENQFKLTFNNNININIETNKGKNNFSYINGHRINKFEIVHILREMTCYNEQSVADKFIENIAKLGLSVFIGITSGYKTCDNLYRFKAGKKRSEFKLCIDDTEINIKSKKILNALFEDKINKRYLNISQIEDIIHNTVETAYDYVKFKLLIGESYKIFMQRSKEFLEKKIKDTESEAVKYYESNKGSLQDAILVQGSSGKYYIVSYNSHNSFVYINPQKNNDKGYYEGGTYICMIDQSSVKSNIGYDTVISKMMALKHDSSIASSIYNLNDELNKEK